MVFPMTNVLHFHVSTPKNVLTAQVSLILSLLLLTTVITVILFLEPFWLAVQKSHTKAGTMCGRMDVIVGSAGNFYFPSEI
jgi:hypothetical protein